MEINMINHKNEENSLYKCHFCPQNIDVYGIEKHFATFHNFRSSIESDYVCEFCDDFEEFESQTNLFHHIQNTHNLMNDEKIQSEEIRNVDGAQTEFNPKPPSPLTPTNDHCWSPLTLPRSIFGPQLGPRSTTVC